MLKKITVLIFWLTFLQQDIGYQCAASFILVHPSVVLPLLKYIFITVTSILFAKSTTICPYALLSLTPYRPNLYPTYNFFSLHLHVPWSLLQSPLLPTSSNLLQISFLSSDIQPVGHRHWIHLMSTLQFPTSNIMTHNIYAMKHNTLSSPLQHYSCTLPSRFCPLHFSSYLHHGRTAWIHLQCFCPCFLTTCIHNVSTFLLAFGSTSSIPLPVIVPTFRVPILAF